MAGHVAVVCAGTSDIPVAEEAAVTLETFGSTRRPHQRCGRRRHPPPHSPCATASSRNAVIVAAGMEGALPSAVAGLISKPVIAVPTSIGYGASFGGIAALLGMLNSCGSGVTVVNIDNGFGAAYAAANISRLLSDQENPEPQSAPSATPDAAGELDRSGSGNHCPWTSGTNGGMLFARRPAD